MGGICILQICITYLIWFILPQSYFNLYKNGDIRKIIVWSFRLWNNYFFTLNIEGATTLQSSITFVLFTLYM